MEIRKAEMKAGFERLSKELARCDWTMLFAVIVIFGWAAVVLLEP